MSSLRRAGLRAFCGGTFPWPLIGELSDGSEVTACYLVHEKQKRETRAAKPFLKVTLGDRTGTIDAVIWEDADRLDRLFEADDVVGVRGRISSYQDRLQVNVLVLEPLDVSEDDLEYFLPSCPRDRETLGRELDALVQSVKDAPLRLLLERCLGRRSTIGRSFRVHPAAKRNHHAYIGGLLEHSLSVATLCDRLAAHYASQGAALDRDLLIAGALLHDVGKVRELSGGRTFSYTTEGQLLGHILIGLQMVAGEAERVPGMDPHRLLLLQHLIASHQGRLEWASPKVPQLLEAVILHYSDDLDSKMNPAIALVTGLDGGEWSPYDRHLERAFFNPGAQPPVQREPIPPPAADPMIDLFRD